MIIDAFMDDPDMSLFDWAVAIRDLTEKYGAAAVLFTESGSGGGSVALYIDTESKAKPVAPVEALPLKSDEPGEKLSGSSLAILQARFPDLKK